MGPKRVVFNYLLCHQLQQFRQKKDNKGSSSHGKSSKKSSKSEQHESYVDAAPNSANSTALPQVLEGETVSSINPVLGVEDSSVSSSTEDSVAPDANFVAVDPLSIAMTYETASIDNANMDKQEVCVHENNIELSNSNDGERIDMLASPAIVETIDSTTVTYELESSSREKAESLPLKENTPDMFLICARGDQVTDVGCALLLSTIFDLFFFSLFPLLGTSFGHIGANNVCICCIIKFSFVAG